MVRPARTRSAGVALAACGLALLAGGAAAQEAPPAAADAPTLSQPPRFSEGFELRTDTQALERAPGEGDLRPAEPLGRDPGQSAGELGGTLRQAPLRAPDERPAADRAVAGRDAGDGTLLGTPPFDLLAGPATSRRENLPDEAVAADPAAGPAARALRAAGAPLAAQARAGAPPAPADLFRSIGPVRSPVFDEAGRRGLDTGLDALRRALPAAADDPFAPTGVRIGRFIAYPMLEQSLGVSDNLTNSLDGVRGSFSQTTLSGRIVSDWSRHAAEINAAATYRRNFAGPVREEPQIDVDARLRLDLGQELTATLRGALAFSRDDGFAGETQTAADGEDVLAYSLSAELARDIGRFNAAMTLEAVREDREDGVVADGFFTPGDSFSTYTAGLRGGYGLSAALSPFLAASVGRRLFDDAGPLDAVRDSVIPAVKAGLKLDFGEKISGEVALGYAWNIPDDAAFDTAASPTIDAAINWSPRRGTDVLLKAATVFEPDAAGGDTATLYQGTLGVRHRATARLDLEAQVVAGLREREIGERERLYSAETGVSYWLNRRMALVARYRFDRFDTGGGAGDYDANTVRLGVRLQR